MAAAEGIDCNDNGLFTVEAKDSVPPKLERQNAVNGLKEWEEFTDTTPEKKTELKERKEWGMGNSLSKILKRKRIEVELTKEKGERGRAGREKINRAEKDRAVKEKKAKSRKELNASKGVGEGERSGAAKEEEIKKSKEENTFSLKVLGPRESQLLCPALALMICESCHSEMKAASSAVEVGGCKTLVTIALCAACVRVNKGIKEVIAKEEGG